MKFFNAAKIAALSLVITVMGGISAYAADLTVKAGDVKASASDTSIKVPVTISNNPGICSLGFDVKYDSDAFTLASVDNGAVFDASSITAGDLTKDPYTVSASALADVKTNGDLVYLNFKKNSSAKNGTYSIELSKGKLGGAWNINETECNVSYSNGSITVGEAGPKVYPYGDVDLDGYVTASDAACVLQKALRSDYKMPIEIAAAEGKL